MGLLEEAGSNPFPNRTKRTHEIGQVLGGFNVLEGEGARLTVAGRVRAMRTHGGSSFVDIEDGTGRIQLFFKKDELEEGIFQQFIDTIDTGDFIQAAGTPMRTKSGQESLLVSEWQILTKTLRPIPDEWYGLADEDERFRKRYLDMLLDKEVVENAKRRSLFWNSLRSYLLAREFIEVETPVLENTTGGADARPFITHHNALDMDVFLRISAGELWQKQLLVGGLPKTFEIGRIFRNEGMSREHLQDYTQLEFYQAYSDYEQGMLMVTDMYRHVAKETFGTLEFTIGEHQVDLGAEWVTYDFCDVLKKEYGIDPLTATLEEVKAALKNAGIEKEMETMSIERGVDLLWKRVRKGISGPGFLIGVPVYLEPLAKRSEKNKNVVERFQIILAGSEMGKGFSELNNPIDQLERFQKQQALRDAGDDEAQMADMDFVEALEYGMPPSFGFGLSERLFSFLSNKDVREAQLFPLMRPRES